ncbi:MAG: oxidoreductase, partial [Actinobacteria bacterium]|nr:oxidoreductase [Actinomycetota bacterium]
AELICRYHGWRYASGTAGCTYIPAHPAEAPARSICVPTLPAVESHGLVWTCEAPPQPLEAPIALPPDDALALRPMPVGAPPSTV